MALEFIDKFASSVSRTVKQVSDNTKSLADKNRLRRDITALENELRNRFCDIGVRCFDEQGEQTDSPFADMFAAVKELQAAIAEKRHELEILEGTLICQQCGGQIVVGSRFCPGCGAPAPTPAPAPAPQPSVQPVCPICGETLAPDAVFCASCGNKIGGENVPAAPSAPAQPAAPVQSVCPNCGEMLAPDALFCAVCGTKAPGID
ncbi:MAG: zinc ribbon domain-containing protein [Oscillospiraceae bacterium]|nr:zinc ribbon domain-containing protein [Oscillospiraceae bacterium]